MCGEASTCFEQFEAFHKRAGEQLVKLLPGWIQLMQKMPERLMEDVTEGSLKSVKADVSVVAGRHQAARQRCAAPKDGEINIET